MELIRPISQINLVLLGPSLVHDHGFSARPNILYFDGVVWPEPRTTFPPSAQATGKFRLCETYLCVRVKWSLWRCVVVSEWPQGRTRADCHVASLHGTGAPRRYDFTAAD